MVPLDPAGQDAESITTLLQAATAADGVRPLSEQAELAVRHPRRGVEHLGIVRDGQLVGYAQVIPADHEAGVPATVEGVVHPDHRRGGLGSLLRDTVTGVAGTPGLLAWAHGGHPGAHALAATSGARRVRELWQMRRSLPEPMLPAVDLPAGVRLRSFVPGQDEQAWLTVNAAAFAHHPEQGRTTLNDLRERMDEPWFDPVGFLLAEDETSAELLGFHWTKVHRSERAGEVYVVGVAPAAQGRRLGGALTRAGLHHLAGWRDRDGNRLEEVLLYVEGDNHAALRVYRSLGFEVSAVDEQFSTIPDQQGLT